ncbi:hypothetical protein GFS60_02105 [Rhodococcus sp. WAY2]|nr:hypothetical protein GFS60_02105 [Rhodococcus sp. WAY2]
MGVHPTALPGGTDGSTDSLAHRVFCALPTKPDHRPDLELRVGLRLTDLEPESTLG